MLKEADGDWRRYEQAVRIQVSQTQEQLITSAAEMKKAPNEAEANQSETTVTEKQLELVTGPDEEPQIPGQYESLASEAPSHVVGEQDKTEVIEDGLEPASEQYAKLHHAGQDESGSIKNNESTEKKQIEQKLEKNDADPQAEIKYDRAAEEQTKLHLKNEELMKRMKADMNSFLLSLVPPIDPEPSGKSSKSPGVPNLDNVSIENTSTALDTDSVGPSSSGPGYNCHQRACNLKTGSWNATPVKRAQPESHKPVTYPGKCPGCNAHFASVKDLRTHQIEKAHCYCGFCAGLFISSEALKAHMAKAHFSAKCSVCGGVYEDLAMLQNHQVTTKHCYCQHCGCFFFKVEDYGNHMKQLHPYTCITCGKSFPNLRGLKDHIVTLKHFHPPPQRNVVKVNASVGTNFRPVRCPSCKLGFARDSDRRMHQEKKQHAYCKICKWPFITTQGAYMHHRSIHG